MKETWKSVWDAISVEANTRRNTASSHLPTGNWRPARADRLTAFCLALPESFPALPPAILIASLYNLQHYSCKEATVLLLYWKTPLQLSRVGGWLGCCMGGGLMVRRDGGGGGWWVVDGQRARGHIRRSNTLPAIGEGKGWPYPPPPPPWLLGRE